jgi:hypothetical protein
MISKEKVLGKIQDVSVPNRKGQCNNIVHTFSYMIKLGHVTMETKLVLA